MGHIIPLLVGFLALGAVSCREAPTPELEDGDSLELASIFSSDKPDVKYNAVDVTYYELVKGTYNQRATDQASLQGLTLEVWWKTLKYTLTLPKLKYDPFTGVLEESGEYGDNAVYYLSGVQIDRNLLSSNTYAHFRAKLFANNSRVYLNYAQYEGKTTSDTYSEAQLESSSEHTFYSQVVLG